MEVVTATQMQRIDGRAIEDLGIPGVVLMERAGLMAYQHIRHFLAAKKELSPHITILAGKGNNGGDGLVLARLLANKGYSQKTILLGLVEDLKGEAGINGRILKNLNLHPLQVTSPEEILPLMEGSTLIIDALLGTGLKGEVRGLYREAIKAINNSLAPVISLDIPSGLDSDTGKVLGQAVQATMTITFALPKLGHFLYPGASFVGDLKVVEIGIPKEAILKEGIHRYLLPSHLSLPQHPVDCHKGDRGHLLLLAGSTGMTGAAALGAQAALRGGCGLLTVGVPKTHYPVMAMKLTEAMTRPLLEGSPGSLGSGALEALKDLLPRIDAIALGPGLGRDPSTASLVKEVLGVNLPLLLDADGINLLEDLSILQQRRAPTILTPHPGEMARLLSIRIPQVLQERLSITEKFAKDYGVILVLKGVPTIISDGETTFINRTGNEGMASAGSGDVLTGLIASLLVQGAPPLTAASLGVYLHGLAGDLGAFKLGTYSLIAGDLIEYLPQAINDLQRGGEEDEG